MLNGKIKGEFWFLRLSLKTEKPIFKNRITMITRIAHVCLNVKNLNQSVQFYQMLGFKPKFEFTKDGSLFGVYLMISDGNYIELFEKKELGPIINNGLAHFCLESPDIDALCVILRDKGIEFTPKKLGCDNTYQIWLADPDGNRFEIHQYSEKSSQLTGRGVEADW
jgi:catechol 2,3-dioxygenase-like lactoylglutathione lyase family enzyme